MMFGAAYRRTLLDAITISSVRKGPDGSSIAADLVDSSDYVPHGTADAVAAGATASQARPS